MNGPFWKVPYVRHNGFIENASVEEVQAALPDDVEGLTVDEDTTNYPCVQFPAGSSYDTMKRVKEHLEAQGFEVS